MTFSKLTTISEEELKELVKNSYSKKEVLNALGISGRGHSYDKLNEIITNYDIDISHFVINKKVNKYENIEDVLIEDSPYKNTNRLKKRLIKEGVLEEVCVECDQLPLHNGKPLTLQLDHINGISNDNRLENLRLLCPNCHSQTPTYSGKNSRKEENYTECKDCGKTIKSDGKYGLCLSCFNSSSHKKDSVIKSRKFNPTYEQLKNMLIDEKLSFTEIGRRFGVSDNAVRKRAKLLKII